ncbi:hypothetical protein BUE93_20910 [Chromobacterium amazonense]|uniref:Uncharacterized protein n=1 Tax=Chromobacterium amazonense TaxID=1382803 RepID=A0A2S9WZ24_9NEIS|nr:hypothetical protein [Chromobacterium amazonense]PRP68727.1 hypothetical protein BUE93_20910 [Chromobacterium amazonense]
MFATATHAPAAAHSRHLLAANTACYEPRPLAGYRVQFQQPRTRRRVDNLILLARSMGEALDRADTLLPGYLMSGWGKK